MFVGQPRARSSAPVWPGLANPGSTGALFAAPRLAHEVSCNASRRSRHRTRARRFRTPRRRRTTPHQLRRARHQSRRPAAVGGPRSRHPCSIYWPPARSRRRILELGTSYGYSTVWLAAAARATRRQGAVARAQGVQDRACAPGADARRPVDPRRVPRRRLPRHAEDAARAVRLRAARRVEGSVPAVLRAACIPSSRPGGIIAADNMLLPESRAAAGRGLSRARARRPATWTRC